jgi:hypothetical protein
MVRAVKASWGMALTDHQGQWAVAIGTALAVHGEGTDATGDTGDTGDLVHVLSRR